MIDHRRKYRNEAHKQRAYRARNRDRLRQEREEGVALRDLCLELVYVVRAAAGAGDQVAIAVTRETPIELVGQLIAHFRSDQLDDETQTLQPAQLPACNET